MTDLSGFRFGDPLTPRELEILTLMANGQQTADMARRLFVAESTIETHAHRILVKLGVHNRTHAVAVALRTGHLRPDAIVTGYPPATLPASTTVRVRLAYDPDTCTYTFERTEPGDTSPYVFTVDTRIVDQWEQTRSQWRSIVDAMEALYLARMRQIEQRRNTGSLR